MLSTEAMKDIRFPKSKVNILLRGGILLRPEIREVVDTKVVIHNASYGKARRILRHTPIEVLYNGINWKTVKGCDYEELRHLMIDVQYTEPEKEETAIVEDENGCEPIHAVMISNEEISTEPKSVDLPVTDIQKEAEIDNSLIQEKEVEQEAPSVEETVNQIKEFLEAERTDPMISAIPMPETKEEPTPVDNTNNTFAAHAGRPVQKKKHHH